MLYTHREVLCFVSQLLSAAVSAEAHLDCFPSVTTRFNLRKAFDIWPFFDRVELFLLSVKLMPGVD